MSLAKERASKWANQNEKDRGGERGESAKEETSVKRRGGGQEIRPWMGWGGGERKSQRLDVIIARRRRREGARDDWISEERDKRGEWCSG